MLTKEETQQMLQALGITRWDFMPLEKGRMNYINAKDEKIAESKYEIICSHGPGKDFTMGYAIESFVNLGVPIIPRQEDQPDVHDDKTIDDADAFAHELAAQLGFDFVMRAMHLFSGIREFKMLEPVDVGALDVNARIKQMLEDLAIK